MNLTHHYQTLPDDLFSPVLPHKFNNPQLIALNNQLINQLDITELSNNDNEKIAQWFSGNGLLNSELLKNSKPIAQAYAGHQFGHLNILGDGRAILLGELMSESGQLTDLQLKGSGRTPYSRGGDGKASLAPMLREYLMSEAMFALNIPTTRSLAVVTTGETVLRHTRETGAILARTASSHIRVGTFVYANLLYQEKHSQEICSQETPNQDSNDTSILSALLDYTVNRHYPQFNDLPTDKKAISLLEVVMDKQAELVANWQRVGFIHGVMNTDNVTISGETIDYGPCAFMDGYDENTVYSSIDRQGRYGFGNQMPIMEWNMARFAESLLPLIHTEQTQAIKIARKLINTFEDTFLSHWSRMLCAKIGLPTHEINFEFANELLELMQLNRLDYTNTFRDLTLLAMNNLKVSDLANLKAYDQALSDWINHWQQKRQTIDITESIQQMQTHNPMIISRNHLVEKALTSAESILTEDNSMEDFNHLLASVQQPYNWDVEYLKTSQTYQQPASEEWNERYQTFCGT